MHGPGGLFAEELDWVRHAVSEKNSVYFCMSKGGILAAALALGFHISHLSMHCSARRCPFSRADSREFTMRKISICITVKGLNRTQAGMSAAFSQRSKYRAQVMGWGSNKGFGYCCRCCDIAVVPLCYHLTSLIKGFEAPGLSGITFSTVSEPFVQLGNIPRIEQRATRA